METEKTVEPTEAPQTFNINDLAQGEGVNISQFEGRKSKIAELIPKTVSSKYTDSGKQETIRIVTEPIGDVTFGEEKKPLVASELFNIEMEDGKPVWRPNSNLAELLQKHNLIHPKDLIGVEVTLCLRVKKDNRKFLGFQ